MNFKNATLIIIIILFNCAKEKEPYKYEVDPDWSIVNLSLNKSNWGIMDMDFASEHEGWAVGIENLNSENQRGFILHYNGAQWTEIVLPGISDNWVLWDVTIINTTDIWAAGADYSTDSDDPDVLMLHYKGTGWEKVFPTTDSETFKGLIKRADFSSPDEGWAVGTYQYKGLILKYENSKWSKFEFERAPFEFWGLTAIGYDKRGNWWLSGWESGSAYLGFIYKLENHEWIEYFPERVDYEYSINAFHFNSANDGWAAGIYQMTGNLTRGIILRLDNDVWYKWGVAAHPFENVEFFSILPLSGEILWAAGGINIPYVALYTNTSTRYEGDVINLPVKDGIIRSIYFSSAYSGWAAGSDFSRGENNPVGLLLRYEKNNQ